MPMEGSCDDGLHHPSLLDRVVDDNGFRATVRYVGPVCTAKDPSSFWIGVEFDDPARGKHDGAVQKPDGSTVRYFSCVQGGSGSFLKPGKFSTGVSMVEALRSQYVGMDAPLVAPLNLLPNVYASTSKGGQKAIEFYGESKIRRRQQVDSLNHCTVREASISGAGELQALSEAAGSFVHVDLKANLLSSWVEVGRIVSEMPLLEVLSLGSNRMRRSKGEGGEEEEEGIPASLTSGGCRCLRVLEITSCGIASWAEIAMLGSWAPGLEELCAADNDLSDVCEVAAAVDDTGCRRVEGFGRLRSLDLSETGLTCWKQVMCFSSLPVLAILLLNHNRIVDVDHMGPRVASSASARPTPSPEQPTGGLAAWGGTTGREIARAAEELELEDSSVGTGERGEGASTSTAGFSSLEAIALSGNRIGDWGGVDRLGGLTALRSLRFGGNPVTSGLGASEARAMCIARLPKLQRVNGSECGARERTDAEKLYLRGLLQELDKAQQGADTAAGGGVSKEEAEAQIAARHPRYRELWALHGDAMAFGGRGGGGTGQGVTSMASDMVQVRLTSLAAASCTVEPTKKRLPASMTVGRLKQLCKRLFKVDTDQQILSHRPEPGALLSTLDDDGKTLSYFCVGEGSEILVNEVDERQQARDRDRARQEDEERLADQLRHGEALDAVKRGQVAQDTASAQLAAGK